MLTPASARARAIRPIPPPPIARRSTPRDASSSARTAIAPGWFFSWTTNWLAIGILRGTAGPVGPCRAPILPGAARARPRIATIVTDDGHGTRRRRRPHRRGRQPARPGRGGACPARAGPRADRRRGPLRVADDRLGGRGPSAGPP